MGNIVRDLLIGGLENLFNIGQVERGNQQQTGRIREANQLLYDADRQVYDTLDPYRQPGYLTGSSPTFSVGGVSSRTGGSSYPGGVAGTRVGAARAGQQGAGNGALDLDKYFSNPTTALGVFENKYGQGFNWQGLGQNITNILNGARPDANATADQAGGFFGTGYDPNQTGTEVGQFFDPSIGSVAAFKAKALTDSAASSRDRLSTARQSMLSRGLASGYGLSEMAGDIEGLGYGEAQQRAAEATDAAAKAEAIRNNALLEKGKTQAGVYSDTLGYNTQRDISRGQTMADTLVRTLGIDADMAKSLADELRLLGIGESDAMLREGEIASGAAAADIAQTDWRKGKSMDYFQQAIDRDIRGREFEAGMADAMAKYHLQTSGQQSANLVGQDFLVPQIDFMSKWLDRRAAVEAAAAGKPDSPSPISAMFGIPLG